MKVIKKLGLLSVAYVACIFYAIVGLFEGIMMAVQINNPAVASTLDSTVLSVLSGLGWWLVLIMPIVFAIIGFIMGILLALIYNLIVKFTGGLKVKLE